MQLKITGSKGRTVDVDPGVTLRITGDKLADKDMRKEVTDALLRSVPKIVEKILGEQLTIEDAVDGDAKGGKK